MLRAYLWKEWREQRWWVLLVVLGCLPLGIAATHLPQTLSLFKGLKAGGLNRHLTLTVTGMGLALLVLAGNLVARETRGSGFGLMARLPGGVGRPLLSKSLVWCGTVMAVALIVGLYATLFLVDFNAVGFPDSLSASRATGLTLVPTLREMGILVVLGLTLGFWTMAASTWLHQSGLSLPATAVLVGLWWAPFLSAWFPTWSGSGFFHIREPYPPQTELITLLLLGLLGTGCLVAWLTWRCNARTQSRMMTGILFGACLLLTTGASWGWRAVRTSAWKAFRLSSDFQWYGQGFKADRSPYLFLSSHGPLGSHPLIVDERDGSYREAPNRNLWFSQVVESDLGRGALSWGLGWANRWHQVHTTTICQGRLEHRSNRSHPEYRLATAWNGMTGEPLSLVGENARLRDIAFCNHTSKREVTRDRWNHLRRGCPTLVGWQMVTYLGKSCWLVSKGKGRDKEHWIYAADRDGLHPTPLPRGCQCGEFSSTLQVSCRYANWHDKGFDWTNHVKRFGFRDIRTFVHGPRYWFLTAGLQDSRRVYLWDWRQGGKAREITSLAGPGRFMASHKWILIRSTARGSSPKNRTTILSDAVMDRETHRILPVDRRSRHLVAAGPTFETGLLMRTRGRRTDCNRILPHPHYFLTPSGRLHGPVELPSTRWGAIGIPKVDATYLLNMKSVIKIDFRRRICRLVFPRPESKPVEVSR